MTNFKRVDINPNIVLKVISEELSKQQEVITYELPNTINGCQLQVVGNQLFSNINIEHLHVPSNIKVIRDRAFSNSRIKHLTFEEGVECIGSGAFSNNQIETLVLPKSLLFIGSGCFKENPIHTVVISDNVTYIDNSAFSNISGIKEIMCTEDSVAHKFFRDKANCRIISREHLNSFYYKN